MAKTLLHRLFGIGKLPKHLAAQLEGEGILFLEEGITGSVTYRDFRAPGRNWLNSPCLLCVIDV